MDVISPMPESQPVTKTEPEIGCGLPFERSFVSVIPAKYRAAAMPIHTGI
jgi:hypothetical protein